MNKLTIALVAMLALLLVLVLVKAGVGPALALAALALISLAIFIALRALFRRTIWRLRNRLMVTYVFVGAVPILLILALAYSGTWIVVGQLATYLVSSELARKAASLEPPARFLSQIPADRRPMLATQFAPMLESSHPSYAIAVDGPATLRTPGAASAPDLPASWKNFTGLVMRGGSFYCISAATSGGTRVAILTPLTPQAMEKLVPGLGTVTLLPVFRGPHERETGAHISGSLAEARNPFDFEYTWVNTLEVATWDDPERKATVFLSVDTRLSSVLGIVFAGRGNFAEYAFLIIAGLLGIVELVSIVVGTSMTRTITGAIHNLYTGTQQIAHGDFSHRIPARGTDQLADLAKSFNQMTEQLENLVVVAKEKERLQSELSIACDVQNQLFPRKPPPMRTIQLIGTCEPARSVSGDYYDYMCLPNGNLAFAMGDVAGKGISAALLMASIQSIMRTQLAAGTPTPSALVAQINRQLYDNTSAEKYATFFFGLYDENSRTLRYTNAGHLSPLIVSGTEVRALEPTGTVVGLFPVAEYGEESVPLVSDDLLVAYTDGITEPENAYGEEFGYDRLTEVVLRNRANGPDEIVAKVMEAVKHWSHSPELPDDMTVLVARGLA